jgi:hypothetical protein
LTFVNVINTFAGLGALEDSRLVHEQLIQSGCRSDVFVGSSLVDMYAKCGRWRALESVQQHAISKCGQLEHNDMGHVKCGQVQKAV